MPEKVIVLFMIVTQKNTECRMCYSVIRKDSLMLVDKEENQVYFLFFLYKLYPRITKQFEILFFLKYSH